MPYQDLEQQRHYQAAWVQKRRAKWFHANGPCRKCGSTRNLQLDHIDSVTKVSHKIWSWSAARRETELKKCRVLCRVCHDAKSRNERAKGSQKSHLTEHAVQQLRFEHAHGASLKQLAAKYSLNVSGVRHIIKRRTWKHVLPL